MSFSRIIAALFFSFVCCQMSATAQQGSPDLSRITLVIHGGAGTITRQNLTPEKEKAYKDALNEALQQGYEVLKKGGTSLDAVETAVRSMEDNPLFNAGKGAVFTNEGRNELDAAIMDGKTLKAGSVAGVTTVRNPVTAARAVMEKSEHVMLIGTGAEKFAREKGLEMAEPAYFFTEPRYRNLQQVQEAEEKKNALEKEKQAQPGGSGKLEEHIFQEGKKFGTVGAVALDAYGNLAAATSTGGMTNKRFGRVGDVPVIGAGTYADNATCAVSCTGHGEYFIRYTVAHDIAALVGYKKYSVKKAGDAVIMEKLVQAGGEGGAIILDRKGNFSMPFNSSGMYRAYLKPDGSSEVLIFK